MSNVIALGNPVIVLEDLTIKVPYDYIVAVLADALEADEFVAKGENISDVDLGLEVDNDDMVEFNITIEKVI